MKAAIDDENLDITPDHVLVLRGAGGSQPAVAPRRAMCSGCGRTHVLLPVSALVRRADVVEMIGAGLALAASGWGHRRIGHRLEVPAGTVRGWLRRFRGRAEALRSGFTELLVGVDSLAVLPEPRGPRWVMGSR